MSHDAKFKAVELFNQHIELVTVNQTLFRKTVMQALVTTCGISNAAAATHYNNAKKVAEQNGLVIGLGRPATARKSSGKGNDVADSDVFTISEVIAGLVTRTESFISEDAARAKLKERRLARVPTEWKLIKGLGPNVGEHYKLEADETELV